MYTLYFRQLQIVIFLIASSFLISCSDSGRDGIESLLNGSGEPGGTPLATDLSDGTPADEGTTSMAKGEKSPNLSAVEGSESSIAKSSSQVFLNLRSYVYLDDLEASDNLLRFHSSYSADSQVIDRETLSCFSQDFNLYRPSLFMDKGLAFTDYGPPDYRSRVVTAFPGYPEGEPLTCYWSVDGEVSESQQIQLNQERYDFPKLKSVIPVINEKTGELDLYVVTRRDRGDLRFLSVMVEGAGMFGSADINLEGNSFEGWINTGAIVPEGTEHVTLRVYVFGESRLVTSGYATYLEIQEGQPSIYARQSIEPIFAELTLQERAELMHTTMEKEPKLP